MSPICLPYASEQFTDKKGLVIGDGIISLSFASFNHYFRLGPHIFWRQIKFSSSRGRVQYVFLLTVFLDMK